MACSLRYKEAHHTCEAEYYARGSWTPQDARAAHPPPRESALMTFRISFEVNADTADIEREFPSVPVYSSDSQP